MNRKSLHDEIVAHFKGKARLAAALGISRQAVSDWGGVIPEGRAWQIEVVSEGRFKAEQILASQRRDHAA